MIFHPLARSPLSDRIPISAVRLTFTDSFPLDQFALNPTPDSCRKVLQASCCRFPITSPILPIHLTFLVSVRGRGFWDRLHGKYVRQEGSQTTPNQTAVLIYLSTVAVILAIRTYAVWNRDKRVGFGIALLLAACQIPNGIFAERFLRSIDCMYCLNFHPFLAQPGRTKTSL